MSSENDTGPDDRKSGPNPLAPNGTPMSPSQKASFESELNDFLDTPDTPAGAVNAGTTDVRVSGGGFISAPNMPDAKASTDLAAALQDRFASGYGQFPEMDLGPLGKVQSPIGSAFNAIGQASINNQANQLAKGGTPVYGSGNNISVGYDPMRDVKDLKGVMHEGLFGMQVYSGQSQFNPNQFDENGNRVAQKDGDGPDNQSTLGNAVSAKPLIKEKPKQYAKANNMKVEQNTTKVKKPKAAGDGEGIDGALVRRTKSLQSNRRGILGRPDDKKKTLLGA